MVSNSIVVLVDHRAKDSVVSKVARVSSSVIDLDATGMEEVQPSLMCLSSLVSCLDIA